MHFPYNNSSFHPFHSDCVQFSPVVHQIRHSSVRVYLSAAMCQKTLETSISASVFFLSESFFLPASKVRIPPSPLFAPVAEPVEATVAQAFELKNAICARSTSSSYAPSSATSYPRSLSPFRRFATVSLCSSPSKRSGWSSISLSLLSSMP